MMGSPGGPVRTVREDWKAVSCAKNSVASGGLDLLEVVIAQFATENGFGGTRRGAIEELQGYSKRLRKEQSRIVV